MRSTTSVAARTWRRDSSAMEDTVGKGMVGGRGLLSGIPANAKGKLIPDDHEGQQINHRAPACFQGILERIWIRAKVKPNAANAPARQIFAGPHAFCLPVPKRKKPTRNMGPLPNIQKTWTAVERWMFPCKTPMIGHGSAAPNKAKLLAAGCRKRSHITAMIVAKTTMAEKSRRMADTVGRLRWAGTFVCNSRECQREIGPAG